VRATGLGVAGLAPGQRVIAEGVIPCRTCQRCIRGETNLCEIYDELGFTRPGAAAGQVIVPAQVAHVLPDSVSLAEAALAEPAAVAWRALGRGQPSPGERIAVVGDGTVALLVTHLARLYSPAEVVVHGIRPDQAQLAAELGATSFEVIAPAGAGRFDLVIEAAGTATAVEAAIGLARRGGRVVLLGLAGNDVTARLPVDLVVNNDLRMAASFSYTSAAWAEVTELLRRGSIRLGPLLTHRFGLADYAGGYEALRAGSGPRGKVLLEVTAG
jgi:2-desacetyl-2-hydroxyethyl bacteriochlorophyllide A dehydrogenase